MQEPHDLGVSDNPLDLALQALDLAFERHGEARPSNSRLAVWASAAECVWWICAIDEQLAGMERPAVRSAQQRTRGPASEYEQARDADDRGRCIPGLRWVRDRHSHQLPITSELDDTPFFTPAGGAGVLHISAGFIWRPAEDLPDPEDRHPKRREAYSRHVAGMKTSLPLHMGREWLRSCREGRSSA
jgi:hypothetical protein